MANIKNKHVTAHAHVIPPKDFVQNNLLTVPDILAEASCGLLQSFQAKAAS
jgi:hypothetical protein